MLCWKISYTVYMGSAIFAGCGLRVAGHKYEMLSVAMHTLKLIVVYYS